MEMLYKPSQYNYTTEDTHGNLLIVNLLNTKFIKVKKDKKEVVKSLLSAESIEESKIKTFPLLLDTGIIVDYEQDEKAVADLKFNDIAYSDKTLELTLIPTDDCNFKCIYCYQEEREHEYMSEEVMSRIFKLLEQKAGKYERVVIAWFGGEPLLKKDLVISFMRKANEICRRKKVSLVGRMTTNGYNLDLDTFQELAKNKLVYYQISIDGDEETHNKQRPHKTASDSYRKIKDNLLAIKENANFFFQIAIRINMTVTTIKSMDNYLQEMSVFKDNNKFQISWQWVKDWGGEQVKKIKGDMVGGPANYLDFIDKASKMGLYNYSYSSFLPGMGLCEANSKNAFYVDPQGRLHKCSLALYGDNKMKNLNNVGFIDPRGKLVVNEQKHARWLIRNELEEKCKTCKLYPLCFGHTCPYSGKFKEERRCILVVKNELKKYLESVSRFNIFETL